MRDSARRGELPEAAIPPTARPAFSVGAERDITSVLASFEPGVRAASDQRPPERAIAGRLAALPVQPRLAPHPNLDALFRLSLPGLITPVARVGAHGGDWLVCRAPLGASLAATTPVGSEPVLLTTVLRPVARALARLAEHKLTHRAIRADNVFIDPDGAVELGPFWLAPPAATQSAVLLPPLAASCLPEARGPGTPADDVYALGVLLLRLLFGAEPLEGLPSAAVIRRKQERGSLAALLDGRTLPSHLLDLVGAMLADDPALRPSPDRLAGGGLIVGPKITGRQGSPNALPLRLGEHDVTSTPQLAMLVGDEPELVRDALRLGLVDQWLRRGLNEIVLAERVEAVVRPAFAPAPFEAENGAPGSDLALLRIARLLDPAAPLVWQRHRIEPSGIGALIASLDDAAAATRAAITGMLAGDALQVYAETLDDLRARDALLSLGKRLRGASRTTAAFRFALYDLNPTLACRSPIGRGAALSTLAGVLPALERELTQSKGSADAAPGADGTAIGTIPLDPDLVAFIAARRRPARPGSTMRSSRDELRLLAAVAGETEAVRTPAVARRFAEHALTGLATWPGVTSRAAQRARIEQVAGTGRLDDLLAVLSDEEPRWAADAEADAARVQLDALIARRAALLDDVAARRSLAARFGRDGLAVIGAGASALALLAELAS